MRTSRSTRKRAVAIGRLAGHPVALVVLFGAGALAGPSLGGLSAIMGDLLATYVMLLQLLALPLVLVAVMFGLRQALQLPSAAMRIATVVGLALLSLVICAGVGALLGDVLAIGSTLTAADVDAIGRRVMGGEQAVSMARFGSQVVEAAPAMPDMLPQNFFHALAFGSLPAMLVGAILFGLAFAVQPIAMSRAMAHQLEAIYRTLEALIDRVNVLLPAAAFVLGASVASELGGQWIHVLGGLLGAFGASALVVVLTCLLLLAWRCERSFSEVWWALADPIKTSLVSGVIVAALPGVIEAMAAKLGLRRALVEFVAPIVPMFLRAGDALFLGVLAVFVATLTGHPLAGSDLALLLVLAPVGALLSIGGSGLATLALGAGVLVHLDLPVVWTLPILVMIDGATAGVRSTVSTLVACAIVALASRGLTFEDEATDSDDTEVPAYFTFTRPQLILLLMLLVIAMGLVLLAGIGVGLRSPRV